jgi:hypothetical protein
VPRAAGTMALTPGGTGAGDLVLWLYVLLTQVVYVMGWAGLGAFVVLFPRPWAPLIRHRRLLPVVCAAPVGLVVALALAAFPGVGLTQWVGRVIAAETFVSMAVLGTGIVLAMVRYLTATDPIGRQQLKWLAGGAALSGTLALVVWFLPELLFGEALLPAQWLGFSGLPLLAGLAVAVLRYRLFDVDRIISRTVTYGLLTALLGLGYAVVVLGLGRLLPQDSSLVVAAATLAVAAAFQPARRRIQRLVDRRFNRRRYDAAQTIAAFSARLRQEVDLDTLTAELLAVVDQTMRNSSRAISRLVWPMATSRTTPTSRRVRPPLATWTTARRPSRRSAPSPRSARKRTSTWLRTTWLSTSTPSAAPSSSAKRPASPQQRSSRSATPWRPRARMAA